MNRSTETPKTIKRVSIENRTVTLTNEIWYAGLGRHREKNCGCVLDRLAVLACPDLEHVARKQTCEEVFTADRVNSISVLFVDQDRATDLCYASDHNHRCPVELPYDLEVEIRRTQYIRKESKCSA